MVKELDGAKIFDIDSFDYNQIYKIKTLSRKNGNPGGSARGKILDAVCAFDIETSRLKEIEHSILYIWQFQFESQTIIGRSWPEFITFLERLKKVLKNRKLVIFIHNASYEFSFLKGIYAFAPDEVFATGPRRVLKFSMFGCFEFRCSYLHSNMSLDKFLKRMGVKHRKLHNFDYNIVRYPWTELTNDELLYCINDVRGLVEAIKIEMLRDDDNLYTLPLTSTGYVRRDIKRAMRRFPRQWIKEMQPDFDTYKMLVEAFRGGDVHANRSHADKIITGVHSIDESSAYPFTMCNCLFPMSKYKDFGPCTPRDLKTLLKNPQNALLMRVRFENITERNMERGQPYLSRNKCRNTYNAEFDNGRIISAEYLETTITDIDFRIILDIYKWSGMDIINLKIARAGYLPEPLRKTVIEYYQKKTELKAPSGPETAEEHANREYIYNKNKALLNALYGMCATNPVRTPIIFSNNEFIEDTNFDIKSELEKATGKAFLNYAWGIVCTAWARYMLHEVSYKIAGGQLVYKDTDSVKYFGTIDYSKVNEERKARSIINGSFATDPAGTTHYMGVFETDGDYKRFATLGAKKYVYEDENSKLHVTIAGVNKKLGGDELEKIENFKEGFTFSKAGGTEILYNDSVDFDYKIDNHIIRITDNAVIRDSTYTIGLTADYLKILQGKIKIKYLPFDITNIYHGL